MIIRKIIKNSYEKEFKKILKNKMIILKKIKIEEMNSSK